MAGERAVSAGVDAGEGAPSDGDVDADGSAGGTSACSAAEIPKLSCTGALEFAARSNEATYLY